jgi:O-antigen ligase
MDPERPALPPEHAAPAEAGTRVGFGLVAAHLLTVWALALSNAVLGLAMLWGARERRRLRWDWPRTAPLLVPLGLYVICFLVSIADSLDPRTSAGELRNVLGLLTLVMAVLWVRGEVAVRRLVDWLVAMTALLGAYGIGQYLLTDYGPLHQRIPGPFSHYMTFSGVLLIGDFLLLGRLLAGLGRSPRPARRRAWSWVALILINTALLLTLTRGAWVAAGVTLTVALWVRVRRHFAAFVAAVLVGGLLFVALAPDSWTERIRSIADPSDASNYDRLCMAQAAFYMIGERPLFGLGPAMVKERYPIYRHPTAPRQTVKHLHNTFLHLAAERGLLSLAAYLWLMAAGLGLAVRGFRREGGDAGGRADLYLGVILALVGFNLAGLFEANWRDTEVQRLVLFVLAVPCCLQADRGDSEPAIRPSSV